MPSAYRQLFGATPAATTLTTLYTVAAATTVVISTIAVCNRGTTATTFRLAHAPAGAADDVTQYFMYDVQIPANSTINITMGICLATTDVLRGYVAAAQVTFVAWGEVRT